MKDTFSLSEGKICISEEIIRCFQGENTNRYDTRRHYFILAIPIPEYVQAADGMTAGKTAGVQINKTANLGGSAKVVIRGARSAFASGNNQPLYVIDGVPMLNSSTESTSTVIGGNYDGLNRDAGDGDFQPESGRHRKHQHPERFFCRRALWFAGS